MKVHIPASVEEKEIVISEDAVVSFNGNYMLDFRFDEEWDDVNIVTALFVYKTNGKTGALPVQFPKVPGTGITVEESGSQVEVFPCEVPLLSGITNVYVGLSTVDGNGDKISTKAYKLPTNKSIEDMVDGEHEDPPQDIYEQLMALVNSVLTTEEAQQIKTDVLAAQVAAEKAAKEATEAFPVELKNLAEDKYKVLRNMMFYYTSNRLVGVTEVASGFESYYFIGDMHVVSNLDSDEQAVIEMGTSGVSYPVVALNGSPVSYSNLPLYGLYHVIGSNMVLLDAEIKLKDGEVTERTIADGAVNADKIADGAVTEEKIKMGAVTTSRLADGAVDYYKIADNAVSGSKLGAGAVSERSIGRYAVSTTKIADGAVTREKIADGAVTVTHLSDDVQSAISGAVKRSIVTALPDVASADTHTIYMVTADEAAENNVYNEFMAVDGAWEQIGSTAVDLSDYAKKSDVEYLESVLEDGTNYFYVEHAYSDSLGNKIHTTYATKEEFRDAMYTVVDATGSGPDYYANGIILHLENGEGVVGSTSGGTASAAWSDEALVIPAYIRIPSGEVYKVTKIAESALVNSLLTTASEYKEVMVYIPNTVTTFGTYCFSQYYGEHGGHLYIAADGTVPSGYDVATTTVVRMDDPFRVVDDIKKPAGVLPITEGVFDRASLYLDANKMTIYDASQIPYEIGVYLKEGVEGYDNEWGMTVIQGETAVPVNCGTAPHWGLGIAPTFAANTTTVCRFYYVGDTLCGEWVSV